MKKKTSIEDKNLPVPANFNKIDKFLFLLTVVVSVLLILVHFYSSFLGFYYTGDTISSLETTFNGRPFNFLQVFNSYHQVWPPGMGFFYSGLRALPISLISQQHVYVFVLLVMNLAVGYLIISKLTESKLLRFVLLALVFFGGVQEFLFHTAMSESLFIFFWLLSIFSIERFVSSLKERYLLVFTAAAIGMTTARYSALSILFSLLSTIWGFVYLTYKQKKYSVSLIFMVSVFVWLPIAVYLLRNKITDNRLFGLHDLQFAHVTIIDVFNRLTPTLLQDLSVLIPVSLLIGMKLTWNKNVKHMLLITGISGGVYVFFLYYGLLNYRFTDGFKSRLPAISYPVLSLAALGLGSLISFRFPRLFKFTVLGMILAVLYLGYQTNTVFSRFMDEPKKPTSVIAGTEYSQDIRSLCRGKRENKFLLIQGASRNWTGQSLRFYCIPIEMFEPKSLPRILPKDSLLYSAYPLVDPNLTLEEFYEGEKKIYIYNVKSEFELKLLPNLQELQPLD